MSPISVRDETFSNFVSPPPCSKTVSGGHWQSKCQKFIHDKCVPSLRSKKYFLFSHFLAFFDRRYIEYTGQFSIFFFEFDSAMKFVNILVLYFCTNLYFVVAICKSLNFPLLSLRLPMNTFAATTTWKSGKYGLRQVYSYLLFYKGWPQPQIMEN